MKTVDLNILKKNRKFFKCQASNGYIVKLKIDKNSENLELGEQELLVNDVSIVTKYGTDCIYELAISSEKIKTQGICTLQHFKYNSELIDACRNLGGRWCADSATWVFSSIVETEVEELDELYNSELVTVELTATSNAYAHTEPLQFCGYSIASARGRDSGATLSEGVALISGYVTSGGSMKNWSTEAREGTVLRLEVPKGLLENISDTDKSNFTFKVI